MDRRDFLRTTAATTVAATGVRAHAREGAVQSEPWPIPEVLGSYTAGDHRRRLQNIAVCEGAVRRCMRKHLVTSYLPGQCVYNLGEYPCREPWNPDGWDEEELGKLRDHGIQLIQLHEEWNDPLRLFGGNKFSPLNPQGFRRFVDMVHSAGMKVIVYASSGFFERTDPDFRSEWARSQDLVEIYFRYARCSPASPGWRAYLLKHIMRILEEYGVDGIYNDLGYIRLAGNPQPPTSDEVLAFEESPTRDGALEDLLSLIYSEVHRRGGIVKVHAGGARRPKTDSRVYDYLWVGESVKNSDGLREAVKNHQPYGVPCLDMSRARVESEDELYLNAIPYMQFPMLVAGRPFTGERGSIPGIEYPPEENCFWTRHCRAIWKRYQAHPDGPHTYGWWDSTPGRPEARPTHKRWLEPYRAMTEEGTWAWLDIAESSLFAGPLPQGVVASAFANRNTYLVLANFAHAPLEVELTDTYVTAGDRAETPQHKRHLKGRSLHILRRSG